VNGECQCHSTHGLVQNSCKASLSYSTSHFHIAILLNASSVHSLVMAMEDFKPTTHAFAMLLILVKTAVIYATMPVHTIRYVSNVFVMMLPPVALLAIWNALDTEKSSK
jgi:hypothetical protein